MHQITSSILMVRPANFGFNFDTADNNSFQIKDETLTKNQIAQSARNEFDIFTNILKEAGIQLHIHHEAEGTQSTDSIFPNNWFSSHTDGSLITYPMFSQKRRTERRSGVIEQLGDTFKIKKRLKLEKWERKGLYLEGTGSMVLDRVNKIAYACRSNRTDEVVLDEFCDVMGYSKILFDALDKNGFPIYHTNVMMAIGTSFVVVCLESVRHKGQRDRLLKSFEQKQKDIIEISLYQMERFAGNMIQVKSINDDHFLVMSTASFDSLDKEQRTKIEEHTNILHSDLNVIETYGGGSARCMIAEVFLPS